VIPIRDEFTLDDSELPNKMAAQMPAYLSRNATIASMGSHVRPSSNKATATFFSYYQTLQTHESVHTSGRCEVVVCIV
jgi:hypothetical protein